MSKSWEYNHISQHISTENDVIGTQSEGDFGESPTDAPTPKANVQDSPPKKFIHTLTKENYVV